MKNRPYFNLLVSDIESLLSDPTLTIPTLEEIITELKYRQAKNPNTKKEMLIGDINVRLSTLKSQSRYGSEIAPKQNKPKSTLTLISNEYSLSEGNQPSKTVDERTLRLADISSNKTTLLKANLIAHFFGVDDVTLYELDDGIDIISGVVRFVIGRESNYSVEVSKGLFFNRLALTKDTVRYAFKLTRRQLRMLELALKELRGIKRCTELIIQWTNYQGSKKYLNQKCINQWICDAMKVVDISTSKSQSPLLLSVRKLAEILRNIDSYREAHNEIHIKDKKDQYKVFFRELEKSPLTERQIDAILCDEDATLVNAGAGTGKTSTVVGKIAYLLKNGEVLPEEILALADGKDAATELKARVRDRLGVDVEVRTFHSFGKQILEEDIGHRIAISDSAKDERASLALIKRLLYEIAQDEAGKQLILSFVSFHRYPARFIDEFDSQHDYLRYMQKYEPRTLKGEKVKSFEELLIADWLCLHGVRYEYEYPYKYQTATKLRRQYKPDFYLPDYDIYLEHFGIDREGNTAPNINAEQYLGSISWKRELHRKYKTNLIETYSWQRMEGTLQDTLKNLCITNNIELRPFSADELRTLLETSDAEKKVVSLLKDYLAIFKENQYPLEELRYKANQKTSAEKKRASCFFELFERVYLGYQDYLKSRQEHDYADLIILSTEAIRRGEVKRNFKRIIVDEYQDISNGRYKLLQEIINQYPDCRIMCVGDDWQSIYGFTGSDVEKSTKFTTYFPFSKIVPLDQTFRFTKPIIDLSSDFIQSNENQLKKSVWGRDTKTVAPVELFMFASDDDVDLGLVLQAVDRSRPTRKSWHVFLLGRYHFTEPTNLIELQARFPMLKLEFSTIHASKGREAD